MLLIHLGGNELVTTHLGKLTKQAQGDIRALAMLCPETVLLWSDVLPRIRYRGPTAHNKVEKTCKTFNSSMRAYVRKMGGKSVRHPQIQCIRCFEENLGVLEFSIPH
jgi:hypothetical protein